MAAFGVVATGAGRTQGAVPGVFKDPASFEVVLRYQTSQVGCDPDEARSGPRARSGGSAAVEVNHDASVRRTDITARRPLPLICRQPAEAAGGRTMGTPPSSADAWWRCLAGRPGPV